MNRTVFVTGATGHLGPHLLAALRASPEIGRVIVLVRSPGPIAALPALADARFTFVRGDVRQPRLGLSTADLGEVVQQTSAIVHAAAETTFHAPLEQLRAINVDGTREVCRVAADCRRLTQLLHVSTVCVAGLRSGDVFEEPEAGSQGFGNAYERTKSEAEQVAIEAGVPLRIARLSTCVGSHRSGYVHRLGALHHVFRWMERGLVPFIPADGDTPVDLVSTDVAADWLARAVSQPPRAIDICHVAAGRQALSVRELLDAALQMHPRASKAVRPLLVDAQTYARFQRMVDRSRDPLFARVQQSAAAVLPALLHPKVYDTTRAEACWGGPLPHPDTREMLNRVLSFCRAHDWRAGAMQAPALPARGVPCPM